MKTLRGFSLFPLVLILGVIALAMGYVMYDHYKKVELKADRPDTVRVETQVIEVEKEVSVPTPPENVVTWQFNGETWQASSPAPACPVSIALTSPVNTDLVTQVSYPGEYRNDNYQTHGRFVFKDKRNTDITLTAPLDATLVRGNRYIEAGEVQYTLWFEHPCGLAYRFDHVLTLTPAIQKLADTLPEAKPNENRITRFNEPLQVKAGDAVATAVGFKRDANVFVDFGVYDFRNMNVQAQKADYAVKHKMEKEEAYYGICWIDLLPAEASRKLRALSPENEKKSSDYCKAI
ncbi:MAG: hypothetical protein AAB519_03470 [Patescibacteria group bacterium]